MDEILQLEGRELRSIRNGYSDTVLHYRKVFEIGQYGVWGEREREE